MILDLVSSKTYYVKNGIVVYPQITIEDNTLLLPWKSEFGMTAISDIGFTNNVWHGFNFYIRDWIKRNKMRPKIGRCENNLFWIKFSTKKQLILFKLRWL